MLCKVKGIVLKAAEYGDNDKMLTLLTEEKGKMSVCVKGGRSLKSKHMPSCEIFSYSEFDLYERSGKYWVRESFLCESFFAIRRELLNMYLGQYFCEVANEYALYDVADRDLLRLLLNSLYLLSSYKKDLRIIKCAFELRSASIEGFMPDLSGCSYCQKESENGYFDAIEGAFLCDVCKRKNNLVSDVYENMNLSPVVYIDKSVIDAMRFIISAPIERVFSFNLPDQELDVLSKVCETFVAHQLERGFKTLDFYKMLSY